MEGPEVHIGDRVRYKGSSATVVFISDGDEGEFAPGYRDFLGSDAGIMLADDDGETTFVSEPTFELELVHAAERGVI